jgi:adenine deaminase
MTKEGATFLNDIRNSKMLMKVALGQAKADLAIVNAKLVNVYTGELIENCAISIKEKWIAYVGGDPKDTIGPKTEVIDAKGKTVIPGLIDGHTHLAWLFPVDEFLKYALKGGTTTVITETLEIFPVAGYEGLLDLLESFQNQPIKILATAPAGISISHAARGIPEETLKKLLDRDDIIGLGESYWRYLNIRFLPAKRLKDIRPVPVRKSYRPILRTAFHHVMNLSMPIRYGKDSGWGYI